MYVLFVYNVMYIHLYMHANYFSLYFLTYRPINNVLGFSRETLVAVITNIEGREWSRRLNKLGKAENPRASTSDDVECLFSMMRDAIGQNFTAKQVQFGFRKVARELEKRLDPELPFYYHTSHHTRFSEGPLPDFNLPSQRPKRKNKRLPRRELPTAFSVRRATLPVHGNLSVRAQFHNRPVDLPPLPTNQSNVTMDKASAMHLRELLDDTNECFQLMLMTTIRFDKCIG